MTMYLTTWSEYLEDCEYEVSEILARLDDEAVYYSANQRDQDYLRKCRDMGMDPDKAASALCTERGM